ncbi:cell envelope integrity protein TolA [Planctomycetales bacterium ZRK34]|nr:cell envelope integrity protein TolA [Planctomycetales bacterium ZRK34]
MRLDEAGLRNYLQHDHAAMTTFFSRVVENSDQMSAKSLTFSGRVAEQDRHGVRDLVIVADDAGLFDTLSGMGQCGVALIAPTDPQAVASAKPGDSIEFNVELFGLLDAYSNLIPEIQTAKPMTVHAVFTSGDKPIARATAEVKQYPAVIRHRRPSMSFVAAWAQNATYDYRKHQFTFMIGRHGATPATLAAGPIPPDASATFLVVDPEARAVELAQEKQARHEAAVQAREEASAQRKAEVAEQNREFYAKKAEDRAKAVEANKPRQAKWDTISICVWVLSILAIGLHAYSWFGRLHPSWHLPPDQTLPTLRSMIAIGWSGYFLYRAAGVWGTVDAPIIDTWFLCGVGGVVAMLLTPMTQNFFHTTQQERTYNAVHDAVSQAVGTWDWVIRLIARWILAPLIIGGLLCPFLWAGMVVRAAWIAWSMSRKARVHPENDDMAPGVDMQ